MSHSSVLLTPQQWEWVAQLAQECSQEQLTWLSGYLAGVAGARAQTHAGAAAVALEEAGPVTVLYGSQTGNAEKLAQELQRRLVAHGRSVRVESMARYKSAQLKREHVVLFVVSTYGEGDPPDNARVLHEFLLSAKAPNLAQLQFAVLALGDTSYEHFCKTGRDFDERLAALGAKRLCERVECDLDYEESAERWMNAVFAALPQHQSATPKSGISGPLDHASPNYCRKRPFLAALRENLCLSGRGSSKEVRHIELSLEGSGLRYEPGDALGVVPRNCPDLVDELIAALGLDAESTVTEPGGREVKLREALEQAFEITTVTRPFLEQYARLSDASELRKLLENGGRAELQQYLCARDLLDVVRAYPVKGITPSEFVALLRRLPPRLYSIASSFNASPDEVHLTVAAVRYESLGRQRQGVASTYVADRVADGEQIPVFIESNPNFRLPKDPNTAVIMVGPGTGVAPFRAFMAEREFSADTGKNWLFFGDRQFHTDFLYQQEWLDYRSKGLLARIDVAFSRDGADKVYVQHRMRENSRELFAWLEEGAHFYVCGDAQRMAKDVHEALLDVVALESGRDRDAAAEYVSSLQTTGRYQRDIY